MASRLKGRTRGIRNPEIRHYQGFILAARDTWWGGEHRVLATNTLETELAGEIIQNLLLKVDLNLFMMHLNPTDRYRSNSKG